MDNAKPIRSRRFPTATTWCRYGAVSDDGFAGTKPTTESTVAFPLA